MNKKIVITGAFGFIGRYTARAASREGYLPVGIGRGGPRATVGAEWGMGECRDAAITPEALAALEPAPDLVIHCAGSASVGVAASNPLVSLADNIVATSSVLEYARLCERRPRVVLLSSAAVYGETGSGRISEAQPVRPISVYGTHKVLAEDMGRWYAREHKIALSIVRLFSVYGPGMCKEILWGACQKAADRQIEFSGTGSEVRDFLHVEDAAKLILLAAQPASPTCPVFNGGTGRGTTLQQAISAVCGKLGAPAPVFSGTSLPEEPRSQVAEVDRIQRLGFYPQVNWQAGIDEYVAWFLSHRSPQRLVA